MRPAVINSPFHDSAADLWLVGAGLDEGSVSRNLLTRHLPGLRSSELAHRGPRKTVSRR